MQLQRKFRQLPLNIRQKGEVRFRRIDVRFITHKHNKKMFNNSAKTARVTKRKNVQPDHPPVQILVKLVLYWCHTWVCMPASRREQFLISFNWLENCCQPNTICLRLLYRHYLDSQCPATLLFSARPCF